MEQRIAIALAAIVLTAGFHAGGQTVTTRLAPKAPASKPAGAATTKPAPVEKIDPAVMKILKRLEVSDEKHPRLTAKLDHHVDMLQIGDTEDRTGRVYYQAGSKDTAAKFRIHFDTLRQGRGIKSKNVEDYVFDGAWLTVRKERIKQMIRYQVPPGEKLEPIELGKGPFPVPFGQKAESVIRHFVPSTRRPATGDPPKTDYIKLVTRPAFKLDMSLLWIEMWVHRETGLPVKIVAEDHSENRTTVVFEDIETPKSFPRKIFELPRPPRDWEYRVVLLRGKVKGPGSR